MAYMIYRTYRWGGHDSTIQDTPNGQKFGKALMAFDTLLPLTMLVVGIVGAVSVIPMGSAASYALIGAGAIGMFFSLANTAFFTKYPNTIPVHNVGDAPFFGGSLNRLCIFPC